MNSKAKSAAQSERKPLQTLMYKVRFERGISQNNLAVITGIPQATLSMIENKRMNPYDWELMKIVIALRWEGEPIDLLLPLDVYGGKEHEVERQNLLITDPTVVLKGVKRGSS